MSDIDADLAALLDWAPGPGKVAWVADYAAVIVGLRVTSKTDIEVLRAIAAAAHDEFVVKVLTNPLDRADPFTPIYELWHSIQIRMWALPSPRRRAVMAALVSKGGPSEAEFTVWCESLGGAPTARQAAEFAKARGFNRGEVWKRVHLRSPIRRGRRPKP